VDEEIRSLLHGPIRGIGSLGTLRRKLILASENTGVPSLLKAILHQKEQLASNFADEQIEEHFWWNQDNREGKLYFTAESQRHGEDKNEEGRWKGASLPSSILVQHCRSRLDSGNLRAATCGQQFDGSHAKQRQGGWFGDRGERLDVVNEQAALVALYLFSSPNEISTLVAPAVVPWEKSPATHPSAVE
jgi:hypothetical protein